MHAQCAEWSRRVIRVAALLTALACAAAAAPQADQPLATGPPATPTAGGASQEAQPAKPEGTEPGSSSEAPAADSKPAGAITPAAESASDAAPDAPVSDPKPAASPVPPAVEGTLKEGGSPGRLEGGSPGQQPAASEKPAAGEKPLVPIPDGQVGPVEIETASFKGVTPGVTKLAEVEKAWGAPKEIQKRDGLLMQLFAVEPFDRVELSSFEGRVVSIVIRFHKAFPASAVAQQLELSSLRPVAVSNEVGEILGQAYPERGVLFAFEPAEAPGKASMRVTQIILEPVRAESFVLRAETDLDTQRQSSLRDLEQALKLQPRHARAHWLQGRVLAALGDYEKALAASRQAVVLEPSNPQYRVTRAQILGQVGRLAEAVREAEKAVESSKQRPHVQAQALCLLGDLVASGPKPDYKQAIQHHTQAIKTAGPLSGDRHPAIRTAAKEVLVDAHLGAAHDIAWGDWKEKETAVVKWLDRASTFADDLIRSDGGGQELRFRVATRALAVSVGVRGQLDPSQWVQEAQRSGDELIAATDDALRKAQLQRDLGLALYDALQAYQMRNDHETALKYGERAIEYIEQSQKQKQCAVDTYMLGRLYFRLGAIHATGDQNHRVAVTWFEKAIPLLEKPAASEAVADPGRSGETFVSMGVSYWEIGQRDKAVELTQKGVTLMEQAAKQGTLDRSALAIPYGNLAAMHRQRGAEADAKRFEEMAAKLKSTKLR